MFGLLEQAGYRVARPVIDPGSVIVAPKEHPVTAPDMFDVARIGASCYLVASLLAAYGQAALP